MPETAQQNPPKKLPMAVGWEKKWMGLRLAHQAVMLQDAKHVLEQQRSAVAEHQKRHSEGAEAPPEDDDVVNVGDTTVNHYHQPGAPAATPAPAFPAAAASPSLLSRLAPLVVGATLGAGGVGLGSFLNRQPAPAPVTIPDHPDLRWRLLLPDEQPKGTTP